MVGASLSRKVRAIATILNGKEIAMSQQQQAQNGERDRVGRIMARQQRAQQRVARSRVFANPDGALAREVADILADYGMDERRKVVRQ